jgi:hypothetical protein
MSPVPFPMRTRDSDTGRPTLPQFPSPLMPDANSLKISCPTFACASPLSRVAAERLATLVQLFHILNPSGASQAMAIRWHDDRNIAIVTRILAMALLWS